MDRVSFEISYLGLVAVVLLIAATILLSKNSKSYFEPILYFSDDNSSFKEKNWKVKLHQALSYLSNVALSLLLIALINPHFFIKKDLSNSNQESQGTPEKGLSIYLLLDQSGSMKESVDATIGGRRTSVKKEALMRDVTQDFVKKRPNDLIGLVSFARVPQILSPLTLDHAAILNQIANIHVVKDQSDDGTAIGYAIFKTVNMIKATKHYAEKLQAEGKPAYEIQNSIIIVVTDGLQDPSILDKSSVLRNIGLKEAATTAKSNGVKLYIINIDPNIISASLTPQRSQMESITKLTGGKLFVLNDPGDLSKVFGTINQLETEKLPQIALAKEDKKYYTRVDFYPYLIAFSMLLLFLVYLLNMTLIRKVP